MAVYGIGRGKAIIPVETSQPSSFGAGSVNGFNDTHSFNGGGSSSFGGGGISNGFSSDQRSSGRSSGDRVCHKCNQEGHFARECPQGGGFRGGGSGNCFKCGQPGHRSAQCPGNDQNSGSGFNSGGGGGFNSSSGGGGFNSNSGGGFNSGGFSKCNNDESAGGFGQSNSNSAFGDSNSGGFSGDRQRGGFGGAGRGRSSDRRGGGGFGESSSGFGQSNSGFGQSDSGANGFGGGSSSNGFGGGGGGGANSQHGCRNCGQDGHFVRECPNGGSKSASGACRNCGQEGHFARDCTQPRSGGGNDSGCRRCGATDHMVRECPQPQKCFNCGQEGHQSKDCTNPRAASADGDRKPAQTYEPPPMTDDEILTTERIHTGINYEKYIDNVKVQVTGAGCEGMQGITNFADAGLSDTVMENITRASWPKPTPIQSRAIPIIMAGHDLMACAQTGSGKTAAYLLPVISSMIKRDELSSTLDQQIAKPTAIIIAPTRELAIQISMEARFLAFKTVARVCLLYGGTNVRYQLDQLSRGCHILVATPGRLNHIVNEGKISLEKCRYIVLDEADRMLDMGFESEMRRLLEHNTLPLKSERQTLMFSATFPEEIQRLAQDFLRPQFAFIAVGIVGGANTDITQEFEQVDKYGKKDRLVALLKEDLENSMPDENGRYKKKTLVFVERKRVADFTATFLSQMEFMATSIHGDREQQQREEALGQFKSGKCPILIATAVAARGLDIVGVDHVINYDLPNSIEDYVHRIGRTGRVGNPGRATSFFDSSVDTPLASQLIQILSDAQQIVPDWLQSYTSGVQAMSTERAMFGGRDVRERDGWNTGSTGNFDKGEKVGTSGVDEKWD